MLITWQDIHSVNVVKFDKDHKKLAAIINRLSRAKDAAEIKKIIGQLKDYSNSHFKAEEEILTKTSYPLATNHINKHRAFNKKLAAQEKLFHLGKLTRLELLEFLGQWWIGHINGTDSQYSHFLNSRGIF